METFIPTQEELKSIVEDAVKDTVQEALPEAIRKATRKRWLTTKEACDVLNCSRRHLQYIRDSYQIPYTKKGRMIRYKMEDLEAFLNRGKVRAEK